MVTPAMFARAADALAAQVKPRDLEAGSLLPPVDEMRDTSAAIAEAVVREARDSGVGRQIEDKDIAREVANTMWDPVYPRLKAV